MKNVTVTAKNGVTLATPTTQAINLHNVVYYYENAAGFTVVRYDVNPGGNTVPDSLTLDINATLFAALVAIETDIETLTCLVYNIVSGVTTSTKYNTEYIIGLKDSYYQINGTKTACVELEFLDGNQPKRKAVNSTLVTLVASNLAAILTYSFAAVAGSSTSINASARTITAHVPAGTVVTGLVATFTASPSIASITVGGAPQTSAATANNFSTAKTYVVTAQDTVTVRSWVTTVIVDPA